MRRHFGTPLRIALIYLITAALWIAVSDYGLLLLIDTLDIPASPENLSTLQTLKGWFYVGATTVFLYVLIRRDVLQYEQVQSMLERLVRFYLTLSDANQVVVRAADDRQLLQQVCEVIIRLVDYRLVWVGRIEAGALQTDPGPVWVTHPGVQPSAAMTAALSAAPNGVIQQVAQTGQPVMLDRSVVLAADWPAAALPAEVQTLLALPIQLDAEVLGVLLIGSAGAFDGDEINLLVELTDDVAYGLGNLATRSALAQANSELRRREREVRALVEHSLDFIARFDRNLRHLYVNPALARLMQRSAESCIGLTLRDLGIQEDGAVLWEGALEGVFSLGEIRTIEFTYDDSFERRTYQVRMTPEFDEAGAVESVLSVSRDVSNLKETERRLRYSERRLKLALDVAEEGIFDSYLGAQPTFNSERMYTMLGYEPQPAEEADAFWANLTHPADYPRLAALMEQTRIGEIDSYEVEFRTKAADQTWRHMWGRVMCVERDDEGLAVRMIGALQDVTARVQAQEALLRTNEKLRVLRVLDAAILAAESLPEIANLAVVHLWHLLACTRISIWVFDLETGLGQLLARIVDGTRVEVDTEPPTDLSRMVWLVDNLAAGHPQFYEDLLLVDDLPYSLRALRDEGMRTVLIVPLLHNDELVGSLAVSDVRPRACTEADKESVFEVAGLVAVAMQHAWLMARLQDANHRLQDLTRRLVNAQEQERRHVARELHDELGQGMLVLRMDLAMAQENLPPELTELAARLDESIALIDQVMDQIRTLSMDLRPAMLDDLGLETTLRWYVQRYSERTGIEAVLHVDGLQAVFNDEQRTAIFRCIQEALTNTAKHAAAAHVTITLTQHDQLLDVTIQDDGVGFDPGEVAARPSRNPAQSGGNGLTGMRERAALIGGTFAVRSAPGSGTCIVITLPVA